LIKKFTNKDEINFGNIKYVVRFFIISIALIPFVSSMLGAFVYITQISEDANFLEIWRTWHFLV
jgi:hypothetical protein